MAEEIIPASSRPTASSPQSLEGIGPHGAPVDGPAPSVTPPKEHAVIGKLVAPIDHAVRLVVGCFLILIVQVIVYGLGVKLVQLMDPIEPVVGVAVLLLCIAILTVLFSEVLERGYWLSRFLRLPITPDRRPIGRAIIWSIAGPLALFVYTQHVAKPRIDASASRGEIAPHPTDSPREIVETIVFVVVLVLLLKSFAAEAFVIPTGSMAQTLWGYQKVVKCPICGYQFPVNASSEADAQPPTDVIGCECENCRQPIRFSPKATPDPRAVMIPDPGWTSGDRVLVAKFIYDLFGALPNRLDVVVFKFPGDSGGREGPWPQSGPQNKQFTPINYIKRLIGLPGEMIAIREGKLFVLPAEKVRQLGLNFDDLAGLSPEQRAVVRPQLWRKQYLIPGDNSPHDALHIDNPEARNAFELGGLYTIIRKPPETILAMHRNVYDNDHPASDLVGPEWKRWQPSEEWTEDGSHGFRHKGGSADTHWLPYRNLLRKYPGKPQLIDDFMGYNSNYGTDARGSNGTNWVGDLVLECEAVIDKPEGELVLDLNKANDRFQAVWDLSNGRCSLWRVHDGKKEDKPLDTAETKVKKGSYHLRLANVDRRLTVWVDDKPLTWSGGKPGVDYDVSGEGLPTKEDLVPARIGAKGAAVQVQKIKLWRDTYYTVGAESPSNSDVPGSLDFGDPKSWQDKKFPFRTFYVQPDHFLCLGDNSPQSSDGRSWGLVPERLLLGRAQVVYYPFYFPWWPLGSQVNRVGLIR